MKPSPLTPERLARVLATALLCALIAAAPLAAGGTRAGVKVLLAVPALAALLLLSAELALARADEDRRLRLGLPLWPPILMLALIGLQLVPIPPNLLAFLSPAAAALRADTGADPSWWPVSLDPAATTLGLILQAAFVAVLVTAYNLRRPRQAWLLYAVTATGALVSLIGFAHWASKATTLYGIYPLRHVDHLTGYFATFVNNNTLAGFEVLATLVGLGLLARTDHGPTRAALVGAVVLCLAATLLAGSRGGHTALGVGLLVFGVVAHARPGEEAWRLRARWVAYGSMGLALAGVSVALVVMPEWSAQTLADLDADGKVAAWPAAMSMARTYAWTGSGRDTFAFVYPAWQTLHLSTTVSHPENHLLQLACEAGLPGLVIGIGGGVAAALALLPGIARRGSATDWGLAAGLFASGLQQLVDFGLESGGLSLPFAALLGIALARARRRKTGPQPPPRALRPTTPIVVALAAAAGLAAVAWKGLALPNHLPDAVLPQLATSTPADQRARWAEHPADPFFPMAIAQHRFAAGAPLREVLALVNRALVRFPASHRPHLLAARVLVAARRPAQAAVEFRLAIDRAPWLDTTLAAEAVEALQVPHHLQAALPDSPRGRTLLANALQNAGRHADLRVIMEEMALTHPDDVDRHRLRGEACLALKDSACTEEEATWLFAQGHEQPAWHLRARLAAQRGDAGAARTALEAMGPLGDRSAEALLLTAQVFARLSAPVDAHAALDQLERRVVKDPIRLAEIHILRARLQARHGEPEAALGSLTRALALHPLPRTAAAAARQARAVGRNAEADRILESARRRWPRDAHLKSAAPPVEAEP